MYKRQVQFIVIISEEVVDTAQETVRLLVRDTRDRRLVQELQDLVSKVDRWGPLLLQAAAELAEYFAGTRREFTLPLAPAGTPFQQAVWEALRTIPYRCV